jgi:hypothetical protein
MLFSCIGIYFASIHLGLETPRLLSMEVFPYRFSTKSVKLFVVFMKQPLLWAHAKVGSIVIQRA